jgi:acetyl-CoA carboxylase biotin carboxyl carrier protein
MTIDEIREMIQMVTSTGVAELEVQRGDNRVWIKRTAGVVTQEIHMPQQAVSHAPAPVYQPMPQVTVAAPAATPADGEPDLTDPTLEAVKSPIVGTFYESPAPGSDAFVRVGDSIKPGKVLCIIESMKLMNEIEAEISGTIVKRLVQNGAPVEYGEVMFLVKPN